MATHDVDIQQIKDSLRATWIRGDFGMIAKTAAASSEEFVTRLPLGPGKRVLDVATGTGNIAIPVARRGAMVTGVDIAPNLLEQARERAAAEKLDITFEEGDAEQLPFAAGTFDSVVTMFGAMFAPRPALVASELARVLKPGGFLAMANWTPTGFSGQMFQIGSRHAPPPPGIAPPVLWGDESTACGRLAPYFGNLQTELHLVEFEFPLSPADTVAYFRKYFGPTQTAFSRLDESGQEALAHDLEQLWSSWNRSPDPLERTSVSSEYLQITGTKT